MVTKEAKPTRLRNGCDAGSGAGRLREGVTTGEAKAGDRADDCATPRRLREGVTTGEAKSGADADDCTTPVPVRLATPLARAESDFVPHETASP